MTGTEHATWVVSDPEFQADSVVPLHPVYPWSGHRGFAYDLIRWMRPARVVELGVHWGTSFFAFAQAIKDHKLATELVGVDTFTGDDHAGRYGDEVLTAVNTTIDRFFRAQKIALHRTFFSEALAHVADGSADVIHIDGLHTHEAARFDYESWLPKLAPEGVVLLHDTAPSTGYGSAAFWREIASAHPSFAFEHSWGLGVLFPKGDARLRALRGQGLSDKIALYSYRAEFRLSEIKIRDLTRIADQRLTTVEDQGRLVDLKESRIAALTTQVELLRQRVADRDAWIADLRRAARDADALARKLQAADTLCRERYETIQKSSRDNQRLTRDLEQQRTRAAALDQNLTEAHDAAQRLAMQATALEAKLKEQHAVNDDLTRRLAKVEQDLELLGIRTEHLEQQLGRQRTRLEALMQTRAGRRVAARLEAEPVIAVNGSHTAGERRG